MSYSKEEYNAEPVHYCKHCLSLNIKELNKSQIHVCGDCGNIHNDKDSDGISIDEWNVLYTKEYGRPFIRETELEEDSSE